VLLNLSYVDVHDVCHVCRRKPRKGRRVGKRDRIGDFDQRAEPVRVRILILDRLDGLPATVGVAGEIRKGGFDRQPVWVSCPTTSKVIMADATVVGMARYGLDRRADRIGIDCKESIADVVAPVRGLRDDEE
jgi:hypothetical protein